MSAVNGAACSGVHFLANGRVFLKEQIRVNLDVAGGDAPGHASDDLKRGAGGGEMSAFSKELGAAGWRWGNMTYCAGRRRRTAVGRGGNCKK
jgi:hypothetical protein